MTTAATVLGVAPLIFASGAGALSRFNMGLVIASGIFIGTLFTLFVHPAVVLMIGEEHHGRTNKGDEAGGDESGRKTEPPSASIPLQDQLNSIKQIVSANKDKNPFVA
jgi:predicted RND superfamily exporter protein